MSRAKKILFVTPFILILFLFGAYNYALSTMGEDNINVGIGLLKQRLGIEVDLDHKLPESRSHVEFNEEIILDKSITGFEEIGNSLGYLAEGNNVVNLRGMATLDANQDGLQDIYFTHNGRPLARPSDENHVLQTDKRVNAKPNTLFLNQGNDENGNPIYKSVQELLKINKNQKNIRAELLIENKYEPRESIEDNPYKEGRIGYGVVTADFNGDKKVDILVLNSHYGTPFGALGTGMRIYPGANYLGRKDKDNSKFIETNTPPFLQGDLKDGSNNTYRGEGEGNNTLFINLGDQDNDGIPEWENVTKQAGINTNFTSSSGTVADIDRDGDLDIFIANFIDPDFWGFGMERFPGNLNTLWINQLAETGTLKFKEAAIEYGVSGSCANNSIINCSIPYPNGKELSNPNEFKWNGKKIGQNATHSWAALFADFNNDGFPDLLVANDVPNRIEAYQNIGGKKFEPIKEFESPKYIGCWMGIAYGDLNEDGNEEFLFTNCGSNTYSIRNTSLFNTDKGELNTTSLCQLNGINEKATFNHMVIQLIDNKVNNLTTELNVKFNKLTAPDVSNKFNAHPEAHELFERKKFNSTIAGLEFSWTSSFFDIENDGDMDIYTVGSLNSGNDNFIGDWSGGVGRLLENNSTPEKFDFTDKTYEYCLFNIDELDYSEFPAKKPAPGTGWHKENYVHFSDRDSYSGIGMEASKSSEIKDILKMHEAANLNIATDLNGDGNIDIIVPNGAGYSSVSKDARNLKTEILGKAFAIPPPNKVLKAPINFQEGKTFVYINKNKNDNNWVKILLDNSTSKNVYGIGSKLIINGKKKRNVLLGGRNLSMNHESLHVGLGNDNLETIQVEWPDGDSEPQIFQIGEEAHGKTIVLHRLNNEFSIRLVD